MRSTTVTIAGRQYTVEALPIRQNREWRQQYQQPFRDVVGLVADLSSYAGVEWDDTKTMVSQLTGLLSDQLSTVATHLLGAAEILSDACFAYSPAMAKDRDYIETNGYDEEMVGAFLKILEVAFPFGQFLGLLTDRLPSSETTGQKDSTTEPSSADPS